MSKYAPNKLELASRDVVSRSEATEILEGRGDRRLVLLDLRHLGREDHGAPAADPRAGDGLRRRRPDRGADPHPARRPLPHGRRPRGLLGRRAAHARPVRRRRVRLRVSVHGANRLGGNSLLEAVVSAPAPAPPPRAIPPTSSNSRVPEATPAAASDYERRRETLLNQREPRQHEIARAGRHEQEKVGVFRTGDDLREAQATVEALRERFKGVIVTDKGRTFNQSLVHTIETGYLLDLALTMVTGAVERTESRARTRGSTTRSATTTTG